MDAGTRLPFDWAFGPLRMRARGGAVMAPAPEGGDQIVGRHLDRLG